MRRLALFTDQELMDIASFFKCKFTYIPIPIAAMDSGDNTRHINKTKEKVFDQDAINTAESEGWPVFFGTCRDRRESTLNKEEVESNSTSSKFKKAFGKFKDYLCGYKEKSLDNDTNKTYTPIAKDGKPGFSRPPYID
ncbi:hypothetical protein [Halomonas caseinilytica]|uniref:hypothetical protein n=1 Tax=Halomonas caseinilytica TaxID=438744 RepID=UPI0007E53DC2|nr:hypothetical protein [Halomonas caseinilytica]